MTTFKDLEEPRDTKGVVAILLIEFGVAGILVFRTWSSPPLNREGVVEAANARESASVRLDDGQVVTAPIAFNGAIAAGDHVRVVERARLIGPPAFVVTGIEPPSRTTTPTPATPR